MLRAERMDWVASMAKVLQRNYVIAPSVEDGFINIGVVVSFALRRDVDASHPIGDIAAVDHRRQPRWRFPVRPFAEGILFGLLVSSTIWILAWHALSSFF